MKFTQYVKDYLAKNPDSGLTYREAMKDDGVRCAYKQFEADMCKQGYVRETEKRPTPKRTYNKNTPAVENITINYDAPQVPQPSAPKSLPARPPREIKKAQPAQQPPMSMYAQENPLLEKFYEAIDKRTLPAPVPQPQPINVTVPPMPAPVFNMPPIHVAPPTVNVAPPSVRVDPASVNVNVPPMTIPKELIDMWLRWEERQLKGEVTDPPNIVKKAANYGGNVLNDVVSWLSRRKEVLPEVVPPRTPTPTEEFEDDDFQEPLDPATGEQYKSDYPALPPQTPSSLPTVTGQIRPPTQTITNVQTPIRQTYTRMPEQYTGVIPTSTTPIYRDEGYGSALYGRSPVLDLSRSQLAESYRRRKAEEDRRKAEFLQQRADQLEETADALESGSISTENTEVSNIVTGRQSTPRLIAANEKKAQKDAEAEARREREREEYEAKEKAQQEQKAQQQPRYDTQRNIELLSRDLDEPTPKDRDDHKKVYALKELKKKQAESRQSETSRIKNERQKNILRKRLEMTDEEVASVYSALLDKEEFLEKSLKYDRGNPEKEADLMKTKEAIKNLNLAPTRDIAAVYEKEFNIRVAPSVSDATTVESSTPAKQRGGVPMSESKRVRTNLDRQFAQAEGMGFDDKKEKLKHILHALIDVSL